MTPVMSSAPTTPKDSPAQSTIAENVDTGLQISPPTAIPNVSELPVTFCSEPQQGPEVLNFPPKNPEDARKATKVTFMTSLDVVDLEPEVLFDERKVEEVTRKVDEQKVEKTTDYGKPRRNEPMPAEVKYIIKLFGKWYRKKLWKTKKSTRQSAGRGIQKRAKPIPVRRPETKKAKTVRFVLEELRKVKNCRIPYLRTYLEAAYELRERKRCKRPVTCGICGSKLYGKLVAGGLGLRHALKHCDLRVCWRQNRLDLDLLEAFLLKIVFRCFHKDFS